MESQQSQQTQSKYYKGVYDPRIIDDKTSNTLWSSESVELAVKGLADGYKLRESPFVVSPTFKDLHLRRAGLPFKYTEDEMFVLVQIQKDKIFFADNFGVLKNAGQGWSHIKLRDYQKNLLLRYQNNRFNILLFPRQSGKTTTTVLEIVHYLITNIDRDCVVIAQSDTVVEEIFSKVVNAIAGLPFFMQPGIVSISGSDYMLRLDNGCRLKCGIAKESVFQGFALDFVFWDEAAYVSPNLADKFWGNLYPALANNPNSKCIIASTCNGRNLFYRLWSDAVNKKNTFVPYKIYWYDVPGRDEKFKQETIANMGIQYWEMGFELSFDTQLKSIFNSKTQKSLRIAQEELQEKWSIHNDPIGEKYGISFVSKEVVPYDIRNDWFVVGVDIGEGLEQDDSVIKIKKMNYDVESKTINYTSIGVYNRNDISVSDFAGLCLDLMLEFNPEHVRFAVENNNYGGEFFNQIRNLRKLFPEKYDKFDNSVIAQFERESKNGYEDGIRWNHYNKNAAVKYFQNCVSSNRMSETHFDSVEQYLNFGRQPNDTYSNQYGHDDLVMADVSISYFLSCNNIFSTSFLKEAEYFFQHYYGIENERDKKEKEEKQKEQNRFAWRDFKERDHAKYVDSNETPIMIL